MNITPTISSPSITVTAAIGTPFAAQLLALVATTSAKAPAPAAPPPPAKAKAKTEVADAPEPDVEPEQAAVDLDAVVKRTREAADKIGVPAVKTILKKFNKARASELEPKQFAKFLAALDAAEQSTADEV